jgi:transposase
MIKYRFKLTQDEVSTLQGVIRKGRHTSQTFRAAYVLLGCDEGAYNSAEPLTEEQMKTYLHVSARTIERIKRRFVEGGLDKALERAPSKRVADRKIDGEVEAKLVALSCSAPPAGRARWTLRLLAQKMIELQFVASISWVSVHNVLKKKNLSLGKNRNG